MCMIFSLFNGLARGEPITLSVLFAAIFFRLHLACKFNRVMIEGFADHSEEKKVVKAAGFIKNLQPISVGV